MRWFRSHIRHGSRLALLALAVQFVLTFGHFHDVAAVAAPAIQSVSAQSESSTADRLAASWAADQSAQPQRPDSDHKSNQPPGDTCAICAVIAMASTVLFATPPLLLLPLAVEFLYLTADAEFDHLNSTGVAFQPRAPPAS
jgi:hypothetical protein